MLIDQVLPAIREKWPIGTSKTIYIQQDNAKLHILDNDRLFKEAATIDGFDFHKDAANWIWMYWTWDFLGKYKPCNTKRPLIVLTQLVLAVKCAFQNLDPKSLM